MLKKITAAAMSTVLCLTTTVPCTSDCSEQQTAETYASIAKSAVVMNKTAASDETASSTTSAASVSTTAAASVSAPSTTTASTTEPAEKEPVEEGSLGAAVSYKLYDDGTLYISGRGIMNSYSKSPFKSPELINKAIVSNNEGTILTIGAFVFSNCENMTEIELPDTLISIEKSAFANCSALSAIMFEGADASELGELILPDSIEDIKDSAFANCTSLESVIVSEAVMAVGANAFSGCSYLKSAVIKGEKTQLENNIFNRCSSLNDLTLPFAGFDLNTVNEADSSSWIGYMFGDAVGDYTYAVRNRNGYVRNIPKSLESITITGGKNIPAYAFEGLSSLKKISVPDDIKIIGAASFRNCSSLMEFDMPSAATSIGNEAFANCAEISVDIPKGVTNIGSKAFAGCTSIAEINVPEATEFIGENAFSGCSYLRKAVINGESAKIGNYIFNSCIYLNDLTLPFAGFDLETVNSGDSRIWLGYLFGDAVEDYTYEVRCYNGYTRHIPKALESITITGGDNIPAYAFDGFSSLKKISVPDDIKIIGAASFRNCSSLTIFDMPSAATSIESEAFANCVGISVDIPKGVTNIGSKAFAGCTSIAEINVPEATVAIGENAFWGCTYLRKAVINGESTKIGNYIFNSCIYLNDLTLPFAGFDLDTVNTDDSRIWLGNLFGDAVEDYTYEVRCYNGSKRHIPKALESITITGGDNIPAYAFDGLSSLKKISVPDDIKIIGANSFRNCSSLIIFDMPSAATSIGSEAFANCVGISVDIPKGVKNIGSKAFAGCTSITEINVPEATEVIGEYAFSGCTYLRKAVINGKSIKIGNYIFNGCVSLSDLTLPFTAISEESANTENSREWLGFLFGSTEVEDTYAVRSYNGSTCYIPKSLTDITFMDGEYMAETLLSGFVSIANVTLPATIKEIGSRAFVGCTGILNVFYPGTEEEWENVNVKDNNESIEGKVRFLGEGAVTTSPPPATTTTSTSKTTTTTTSTSKTTTTTTSASTTTTTTTPPVEPPTTGMLGDTNEDGIIDATDASNILALYAKISTGHEPPSEYEFSIYDVDKNGSIDSVDASTVLAYYAYASTDAEDKKMSLEEYLKKKEEATD